MCSQATKQNETKSSNENLKINNSFNDSLIDSSLFTASENEEIYFINPNISLEKNIQNNSLEDDSCLDTILSSQEQSFKEDSLFFTDFTVGSSFESNEDSLADSFLFSDQNSLPKSELYSQEEENETLIKQCDKDLGTVMTGFKTGNNKSLCIKEESLLMAQNASVAIEKDDLTSFIFKRNNLQNHKALEDLENDKKRLKIEESDTNIVKSQNEEKRNLNFISKSNVKEPHLIINKVNLKIDGVLESNSIIDMIDPLDNEHFGVKKDNVLEPKSYINKIYHRPIRMYNKPEKGHKSSENKYLEQMQTVYDHVKNIYKKQNSQWIKSQFQWSWIQIFLQGGTNKDPCVLKKEIISIMEKRRNGEYSVFRRIVEGDDIPSKYFIAIVIKADGRNVTLFDGFYSVNATLDCNLTRMVISQQIQFGTFLRVVNAELLCEPCSIYDSKGNVLKLFYNSTRVTKPSMVGYQPKITFCTYLNYISKTGGIIPCIELHVIKVFDIKILIKVGNYIKTVQEKDLEAELEKIEELIKKEEPETVNRLVIKKTAKIIGKDKFTSECLLTWLDYDNINPGCYMRFFNLKIIEKSIGIHLGTISGKSTCFEITKYGCES